MAQFKEVTQTRGEKITINLDNIRSMQRSKDSTSIYFSKDHVLHVKETPAEILTEPIDRHL